MEFLRSNVRFTSVEPRLEEDGRFIVVDLLDEKPCFKLDLRIVFRLEAE